MNPVERVLDRLDGVEDRNGSGHMALCPGHADVNPSLSISQGDDGRVLLRCHAGCETADILEATGLQWKDLYPVEMQDGHRNGYQKQQSWQIKDTDGNLIATHHRKDTPNGKRVWWTRSDGSKGLGGVKTSSLPLYRSEQTSEWPNDVPVVICEGEPAADALSNVYPVTLGTVTGAESLPGPASLEVLRGRNVVLWADNDEPGRKHMDRLAESLHEVAKEVRVYTWKDAPIKGDAANHPAVKNADPDAIKALVSELSNANIHSCNGIYKPIARKNIFLTPREVYTAAGEVPPWICEPWVAEGGITDVAGAAKLSGKTTLTMCMISAILQGGQFMGRPTQQMPVVYLSEQGNNLTKALRDARIPEDAAALSIMPRRLTVGMKWPEIVAAAVDKCLETGAKLLVVDTFPRWAGLKGDEENNAGHVAAAMEPLISAAQVHGLGVWSIRHANHEGRGRGSTQFNHDVDIVVTLRAPDAKLPPTVRVVEALGRYDGIPARTNIELRDGRYYDLGSDTRLQTRRAKDAALETLSDGAEHDGTRLIPAVADEAGASPRTVTTALGELVDEGRIQRLGMGKKGDPYRYVAAGFLSCNGPGAKVAGKKTPPGEETF